MPISLLFVEALASFGLGLFFYIIHDLLRTSLPLFWPRILFSAVCLLLMAFFIILGAVFLSIGGHMVLVMANF